MNRTKKPSPMPSAGGHLPLILPPTTPIRRGIEVMSRHCSGILLVSQKDKRLLGVVVDSDLRKGFLEGLGMDAPLTRVMNRRPITLRHDLPASEVAAAFRRHPRATIPLVDAAGRVRGIANMQDYVVSPPHRPNAVVLMVGGQGRRLLPLTKHQPKAMLPVGGRPVLETIIAQLASSGFNRFFLAVNHHGSQIRRHFGDGSRWNVDIRYLAEPKPLGTAGALSLLPRPIQEPFIVMNGDLLTKVDFGALMDFHSTEANDATLCVREYEMRVPYGVVSVRGHRLERIAEKPMFRHFVNAGIYVLDPSALRLLRKGREADMPSLIARIQRRRARSVGCFPIREYWIDIGRLDLYEQAQTDFGRVF